MDTSDSAVGKVLQLQGRVRIHSPDGSSHLLKPGEVLHDGDTIVTMKGANVELLLSDGKIYTIGQDRMATIDGDATPAYGMVIESGGSILPERESDSLHYFERVQLVTSNTLEDFDPVAGVRNTHHFNAFIDNHHSAGALQSVVSSLSANTSGNDADGATTGGNTSGYNGPSDPAASGSGSSTGDSGDSGYTGGLGDSGSGGDDSGTDQNSSASSGDNNLPSNPIVVTPISAITLNAMPAVSSGDAASGISLAVSGTVSPSVPAGNIVTITVDGHVYTGVVQADGAFSISVPGSVLVGAAIDTIYANVHLGGAGSAVINTSLDYSIAGASSSGGGGLGSNASIQINALPIINAADAASSAPMAVTGTTNAPAGITVTVTAGGHTYSGTVGADGSFSVNVPGNVLASGASTASDTLQVAVSGTDGSGHSYTGSATLNYSVDTVPPSASITIDPIAQIGASAATSTAPVVISGTVSSDVPPGTAVELTVGGNSYSATVSANGTYSVGIPGNVLAGASSDSIHASVSLTDAAGNVGTATAAEAYSIAAPAEFGIAINPISTINAAEAASSAPVMIEGKVTGNNPGGDLVTLTVAGQSYTGVVKADGSYSIGVSGEVLAAAATHSVSVVSVSITGDSGHAAAASATQTYDVELTAPPISVSLDTLAPLTTAQAQGSAPIDITGTVSANVPLGTVVSASVDGQTYTGTVGSGDTFTVAIPGNVLGGQSSGNIVVAVSAVDAAGNTASTTADLTYAVAPTPPAVSIEVNPIPTITGSEAAAGTDVAITGSVSSNVPAGTTVTVAVNGQEYTGTVTSGDTYSVNVPANELALGAGSGVQVSLSVTGAGGAVGTASVSESYTVDTGSSAVVTLNPVPVINGATAASSTPVAIGGDVGSNVPAGTVVTVTVGGQSYTGTVQSDGSYAVDVPGSVLGSASSDTIRVSVPATSSSGAATITQGYTVELAAPPISVAISPIAAITATEAASSAPVVIGGTVSNDVPVGTSVTLTLDGNTYTGTVQQGGSYSIGVPGNVLAASPTDNVQVSVTTTDAAGNTATSSANMSYTVPPATASIDMTVAPIPTINGAEATSSAPIDITGTVTASIPVAGDTVSVTVGGTTYSGTVQANGTYSIGVPGNELANAGSVQVVITATNANGSSSSSSITEPVTVELTAPPIGVTINSIATVNGAEAANSAAIAVTGTVSNNVPAGTTVTLTVDGQNFTGLTQANGTYSVGVPGNVLANAPTDSVQVNVSTVDAAGNTANASDSQAYTVELTAPAIGVSINTIPTVNGAEAASSAAIAITGSVSNNVPAGTTVTLSVGSQSYTGTVQADGTYSIGIPGNVLAAAGTDSIHASVSTTDAAGNTATATADQAYTVELSAPAIGIGIDQIAPITLTEAASSAPVAITGTVSSNVPAGDTVTLTVNGNTYTGAVTANHTYSIGVPGNVLANAPNDTVQANISSTDAAGNTATATASESYSVYNSSLSVSVALNALPTINAAMAASSNPIMVSGTVSSNVPAGDTVTLSVAGQTYTGTVQAGGLFSVGIPGNVLAGAASDSISANVSVTEPTGQVVSGTTSLAYTVELAAPPISVTINQIGTVNALDALSSAPIPVTGTVSSNVPVGTTVSVSVSGQTYTGTVQSGGTYSVGVPGNVLADASNDTVNANVSTTDAAGNTASASASQAYTVELAAAAISIGLNPIAEINGSVAASTALVAVTGTVSSNVPVGDTVTLTVDGQTYTGTVQAGGTFSIGVPGDVLGAAASIHASVSSTDAAGNTASAGITEAYTVELAAPPISVVVNPIATINAAVAASSAVVDVTGSVSSNVAAGTVVTATVDGHVYSGTVQANGTFTIGVPGNVLANAQSDTITVALSSTDAAGNTASASESLAYAVELAAAPISVSVNAIATVNTAEAASSAAVAITGTVSNNVPVGDTVTVTVGGNSYTGTVQAGDTFSIGVPGNVLAAASNNSVTASVSATDAAGNTAGASATMTYAVELTAPPVGIGINAISTINAAEAASSNPIAITGTVSGNVPTGDIVTLTVGGHSYTGAVSVGGTYSIGVPGNVLANAGNTTVQASVSVTDAAGNVGVGTSSETYSVNTVGPSLTIAVDPIVTINGAAAASSSLIAITGEVSANVPVGDTVTLTAGGHTYTGTVSASDTFSIGVPGNVLAAATSDSVTASVSASDNVGNVGSASATAAYTVELTAPPINIGINPIATINGATGNSSAAIAVTGTVSADVPAGTIVTLSVGGNSYTGAVTALGTYSIGIPGNVLAAASSDTISAAVSTTDAAGNTASANASLSYNVELSGAPVSISINPVATINGIVGSSANPVAITGSVSADVPAGDVVTLSVGGASYTGTVSSNGTYSIGIPGNVLAAATSDTISAGVSVTDSAGNVSSASASLNYSVELAAPPISVTISPIVTINGAMAASAAPVLIAGTVSANVPVGTTVSLTVAGNTYTGLVLAGGIYSIGVPGNVLAGATSDNVQVSVSTTDSAGNVASASVSAGYTVELVAPLISISVNPIGALSALLTGNVAITGSVSSNVPVGTLLTVNVGGNNYTGTVQAGGTYSVGVPALVLLAQVLDIVQVAVSFTDPAGNTASASASSGYTVAVSESPSSSLGATQMLMHLGFSERAGNLLDNRHDSHTRHPGHAENNARHGHALGDLLGSDKFAFSLSPHTLTATGSVSVAAEARPALHISDLLTDHHPSHPDHHAASQLPALHDYAASAPLHAVLGQMLPVFHDAVIAHTQWHRSAAIE